MVIKIKKFFKFLLFIILFVGIGGGIALSGFVGISVYNGLTNAYPREETIENIKTSEVEMEIMENYFEVEEAVISSSFGDHEIPILYIRDKDNENIAVMVHGMGGTKETVLNPAALLLELGYNVVTIDQRNSGGNTADTNTFGILESYDIIDAVNYAKGEIGEKSKILLWGESYGGASAAIALGREESNIDYLVLDCPVSDGEVFLKEVLQEIEDEQGLPVPYMLFTGNLVTKYKLGYDFSDFNAGKWLAETSTPTLIFNSKKDTVTPEYMGKDLYGAIPHSKKMLVTSESSPHIEIDDLEKDLYLESLEEFLKKY